MIIVYLDALIMSGDRDPSLYRIANHFKESYEVRADLIVESFLRPSVQANGNAVEVHNAPMIWQPLNLFGVQDYKPAETPLPQRLDLGTSESEKLSDVTQFRQAIRS